ncbi:MAG: MoaD/ThiS family protein [Promethearchaeota archaeon]
MNSITIELRIFANLRDILGFKITKLDITKGSTIRDLLFYIRDNFSAGADFIQNVLDSTGEKMLPYVKILINGRILMGSNLLKTEINEENSVIAIFPPVGGG